MQHLFFVTHFFSLPVSRSIPRPTDHPPPQSLSLSEIQGSILVYILRLPSARFHATQFTDFASASTKTGPSWFSYGFFVCYGVYPVPQLISKFNHLHPGCRCKPCLILLRLILTTTAPLPHSSPDSSQPLLIPARQIPRTKIMGHIVHTLPPNTPTRQTTHNYLAASHQIR